MPSLIRGYDIFISYRHNDNQSGWVTEFVQALQEELVATIKEPVSVYYDTNPHDGLLETHSVDKSLERKLNSLILIPIISQTYCDTKSFAWKNEFCTFNRLARADQYGKDINLNDGNVTSRILPVQIHDLDQVDIVTFEKENGGALRSIEFIYNERGVNRPLQPNEEAPGNNLNHTYYRNQVNKVANAVKEILHAMRTPSTPLSYKKQREIAAPRASNKTKVLMALLTLILITLAFYFGNWYMNKSGDFATNTLEKSIAILPLSNLSSDEENQFFADGLVEDMLGRLSTIEGLKVISRTSSEMYRDKGTKSVSQIAEELGVSYIVEGSIQFHDGKARINIQLIDASRDAHIWTKRFDRAMGDVFKIQSEVAVQIASELNSLLTAQQTIAIQKSKTSNIKAFEYYQLGRFHWNKRTGEGYQKSIEYFERAIAEDPNYGLAYAGLADTYQTAVIHGFMNAEDNRDKAVELANKALQLDGSLAEAHTVLASVYSSIDWNWESADKEFILAIEQNPNYSTAPQYYASHLSVVGRHKEARKQINKAIELDPLSANIRGVSTRLYFHRGQFQEALAENQRYHELADHPWLAWRDFDINLHLGNADIALKQYKEMALVIKELSEDVDILYGAKRRVDYEFFEPAQADSAYNAAGLEGLIQFDIEHTHARWFKAVLYGYLGEEEKAMDLLEEAFNSGEIFMERCYFVNEYGFRNLHSNSRWQAILKRMNLPTP